MFSHAESQRPQSTLSHRVRFVVTTSLLFEKDRPHVDGSSFDGILILSAFSAVSARLDFRTRAVLPVFLVSVLL